MSRFFIKEEQICGDLIRIEGADAHHIARVLRMKEGDKLLLCDFFNTEYRTVICALSGDLVEAEIVERRAGASEPSFPIVLYMALPKGDKMEWIIQKAVELGVTEIVPFSSAFTVVKLDEKSAEKKRERWQKIAKSAAEQCGRGRVPEISQVRTFGQAVKDCLDRSAALEECEKKGGALSFMCYEKEETRPLPALLSAHPDPCGISFFVGAEGGFSEKEAELALSSGILPVGLGKRILRCETAPLFVLSAVCYRYELEGNGQ
ncbi:MAG: 16S rRNA (uracil(1498)-N(3))-methyltransferase [Clostridia bacterium]|nr:16S rRNA (uracil(1498)-N(3))-methyltransferase [Clostridia bacterium]